MAKGAVEVRCWMSRFRTLAALGVIGLGLAAWGSLASAQTTELVSISTTGGSGNDNSFRPSISSSGQFVAFHSNASNLVSSDTNGVSDIFVRDRVAGTTELVSVSSAGVQGNGDSRLPSISADGRFVAFKSKASNLVSGDTNGISDIFVRDRETGTTELVSISIAGDQFSSHGSVDPSISADGRYVAFLNSQFNIFVRDRQTLNTELVSTAGHEFGPAPRVAISGDGRYVAYNTPEAIYLRDRVAGTTELVSIPKFDAIGGSLPSISADGRYVSYNTTRGIHLRDRGAGTTERVGTNTGTESHSSISSDGRYVAFHAHRNGKVFVRDRVAGMR